jgi:hypothetical protein
MRSAQPHAFRLVYESYCDLLLAATVSRSTKKKGRPGTDRPFWKFAGLATIARRLVVCAQIRCVHHDRLRLDFELEARWRACSATLALRDTFRRDAFPVGKPADPPRELLDSLEEL